ncbi:MAG: beta-propeller domain-containing protein [Clostridiales bacterium]|nr:beta-propeller domain-containing protein [Clostridiales bacterium]
MVRLLKKLSWKSLVFIVLAAVIFTGFIFTNNTNEVNSASLSDGTTKASLKDTVVLFIGSPVALVNNEEKKIDPNNPLVIPVIKNSRTLVPARFVSESAGAVVKWDAVLRKATFTLGAKKVEITAGSSWMYINGAGKKLDVAAMISGDRMMVPYRAFVEALGLKVFYDRGLIIAGKTADLFSASGDKNMLDTLIAKINVPPAVADANSLRKLLKQSGAAMYGGLYLRGGFAGDSMVMMEKSSAEAAPAADSGSGANAGSNTSADGTSNTDFSGTNVQVEGVDEADIVKTDGKYIYQVNYKRVVILKAYPANSMGVESILEFDDPSFYPYELYIDKGRLVVIGSSYASISPYQPSPSPAGGVTLKTSRIMPPDYGFGSVKTIVYDTTDMKNVKKIKEVELEGNYVSSRKISNFVYLISNKDLWVFMSNPELSEMYYNGDYSLAETAGMSKSDAEAYANLYARPSYRDSAAGNDFVNVDYPDIRYFPGSILPNYMIIAAIDILNPEAEIKVNTYLGAGQNIYASTSDLFVSFTDYSEIGILDDNKAGFIVPPPKTNNTQVYRFSLNADAVTYIAKGKVPGTILNQFSMDQFGGNFRIATTSGAPWATSGEDISKNNVYVLDEMMNITGKLEDLAPGEKIYSVRFAGNRGYIVTFRTVDPLFVIDLKDPAKPAVLGQLKIPGYSDYLHPYDENHIIGFGKDAVVVKNQAYYLGMKVALFDVTDVKNPVQKASVEIGDRGTDSDILRNHKALLFSKLKDGLLSFPVTEMKLTGDKFDEYGYPHYGEFSFQGAYVYNLDLESGFTYRGRITHLSNDDYLKAGSYWPDNQKNVERVLYIGDTLYTISKGTLKANDLKSPVLAEVGLLEIPQ